MVNILATEYNIYSSCPRPIYTTYPKTAAACACPPAPTTPTPAAAALGYTLTGTLASKLSTNNPCLASNSSPRSSECVCSSKSSSGSPAGLLESAGVTNSSRRSQRVDTPDVENSGVEEGGIVGVNTTRLEKRVDSECWEWIFRVAR